MKQNKIILAVLTFFIWIVCLVIGTDLSRHKPLWNDELFTQTASVENTSYANMFRGAIPEGNNSPLFYVIQKGICDMKHYRFPLKWEGEWSLREEKAQLFLRIASNFFMATSLALIFYFMSKQYSWAAGSFALIFTLSLPMIWEYWAEARPYSLWFFLTTVQSLIFLFLLQDKNKNLFKWAGLALIHALLSLTIAFGAVQVVIVSTLLWILKDRRWQRYIFLTLIPIIISVFYYVQAPKYHFWFRETPVQLFLQAIPLEYVILLLLYGVFLATMVLRGKDRLVEGFKSEEYFLFMLLVFVAAGILLGYLKWHEKDNPVELFCVSNRYFIFLIPVGMIGLTIAASNVINYFKKDLWILRNIYIILGGMLALRVLNTVIYILSSGTFEHVI